MSYVVDQEREDTRDREREAQEAAREAEDKAFLDKLLGDKALWFFDEACADPARERADAVPAMR